MSTYVDTVALPDSPSVPDHDDPPFLQEPTVLVAAAPATPLADRMADLAYRRRAAAVVLLTSLVVAAVALAYRSPPSDDAGPGPAADGSADTSGMMVSVAAALRSVASSVPPTGATSAPDPTASIEPTVPTAPPTPPTTAPPETPAPTTAAPTTVPPTTPAPATAAPTTSPPATGAPAFCMVWVDRNTTLRAGPDGNSEAVGEVTLGLYWVTAVSDSRPRWYQIESGRTTGWVSGQDVDRQGDCNRRRD